MKNFEYWLTQRTTANNSDAEQLEQEPLAQEPVEENPYSYQKFLAIKQGGYEDATAVEDNGEYEVEDEE